MDRTISDRLFLQFSQLVYNQCGINLHEGKKALLQARLNKRLRATGIQTYEEYFDHIVSARSGEEFVHFLDSISTNLTFFFREPQHFQFLEQTIIPGLVSRRKKDGNARIRIWSAGCSTGEEPYSLAMCVKNGLDDPQRWDFRILATDISTRVLGLAMNGVYSEDKVQKVPAEMRQAHFCRQKERDGNVNFCVSPEIKRIVTFRRLNLKESYPFKGPFDFIFCRNVMIYFDKQTQESLVNKLAGYLAPGGHLFVGHSESLTGLSHCLSYVRPAVYRKNS